MSPPFAKMVFFDLASTLAFVELAADGHISRITAFPGAVEELGRLSEEPDVEVGVVFRCTDVTEEELREALAAAGLNGIRHVRVLTEPPRPDDLPPAAKRLFVGANATERRVAAEELGMRTSPHPRLASGVLRDDEDGPLHYLRIRPPVRMDNDDWLATLRGMRVAPFHVTTDPFACATVVYAIAAARTAARLDVLGFWVDRLGAPDEPQTTRAYLIQDDHPPMEHPYADADQGFPGMFANGQAAAQVLASTHQGILVALPAVASVEALFEHSREIHMRKLTPAVVLIEERYTVAARTTPLVEVAKANPLTDAELEILLNHITPAFMRQTVADYVAFDSRHTEHAGNQAAVKALVEQLSGIVTASRVALHCFTDDREEVLSNVVATLPPTEDMIGKGVVVISAHLDSTAGRDKDNYDPANDPAPGADDDASGMAAVLATSRAFMKLIEQGGPSHREIRFAFFNAEEMGKAGSAAYATAQAALGTQVAAMFHIDMIGYDGKAPARFEVHARSLHLAAPNAGFAQQRSTEQANLIEHLFDYLRERNLITLDAVDPSTPAALGGDRSDHVAFHAMGYPACWVTQDFFPEPQFERNSDQNPNYHKSTDLEIHADFAAQIALVVGAATWIAATR